MSSSASLRTCIARATRRRRARYALEGLVVGATVALGLGAASVAWARFEGASVPWGWLALCAAALALGAAVVSGLRRIRPLETAIAIDSHHGLRSTLATGLELAEREELTSFERIALEDSERTAGAIDASAPFPFERPRWLAPLLVAGFAFAATSAIPPRSHVASPIDLARDEDDAPPILEEELAAAFEDALREASAAESSEEVRALTSEMEQLLAELAEGSVGRAEALARLGRLVRSLEGRGELELRRLDEELDSMGEALGRGGRLLSEVAAPLREGRAAAASQAMRATASALDRERLVSARERFAMKRALERAASPSDELERVQKAREEAERRLLERERGREESPSLLKKERRELEELRKEEEQLRDDRRRLERLRRELGEAAEALGGESADGAGDAMRRAAEALDALDASRRSAREMEALRRLAEQLRDSVREAGASGEGGAGGQGAGGGGSGQSERMQRFSLRATGEGGGESARIRLPGASDEDGQERHGGSESGRSGSGGGPHGSGEGENASEEGVRPSSEGGGQGSEDGQRSSESGGRNSEGGGQSSEGGGQSSEGGGQSSEGGGQSSEGGGQSSEGGGQSREGGGQGSRAGEIELRPAGSGERATAELELPSFGSARRREAGGHEGDGTEGHGDAHDPRTLAESTSLEGASHDESRVEGVAGAGPTRSQLILGAADRGFSKRGYRRVHADYAAHAEEALEEESIPPGYRFYVRRYFQLIRPRDGQAREDER